jgi:hypothetical protein
VIIYLSVERDCGIAVVADDRLIAAFQVDDFQPNCA